MLYVAGDARIEHLVPGGIRPVNEWPKLLVGPMVRRVTVHRAHVFVATSVPGTVWLKLFAGRVAYTASNSIAEGDKVTLDRIGAKLWVGVADVDLTGDAGPGDVISYDLLLEEEGSSSASGLFVRGLLGGTKDAVGDEWDPLRAQVPLGYADGMLPSFVVPPATTDALRIAHGSCRKPHGGKATEADALQLVDGQLKRSISSTSPTGRAARPQQLILTGDQIYADDVAAGLLAAVTEAGQHLLGWDEPIPGVNPQWQALLQPGWRTRFLSMKGIDLKEIPPDKATDYSASHLLRFGEWCAMYIFAWSDALWARNGLRYDLPSADLLLPVETMRTVLSAADTIGVVDLPDGAGPAMDLAAYLHGFDRRIRDTWNETRAKALGYAVSVRVVRRVLANVATYTMFDDHEITDDWFLNRRLHDRLKGTEPTAAQWASRREVGPRMLRNGLSAYAIFQHWGNEPQDFGPGCHGQQLLDLWRCTGTRNNPTLGTLTTQPRSGDALLGITGGDSVVPAPHPDGRHRREDFSRFRWDYAVEFPGHRLVTLDTRTWRHFPTDSRYSWAALASLVPNALATAQTSGAAELHQIATAWRQGGQASAQVVMGSFADFVDAVATLAESVDASRAQVSDRAADVVTHGSRLVSQLPGRASLDPDDLVDALTGAFVTLLSNPANVRPFLDDLPSKEAVLATSVELVRELARFDLGDAAGALAALIEALSDFLETAILRSGAGMARAARAAAQRAGTELWPILTSLPTSSQVHANVVGAVSFAYGALETLTQTVGIDRLAEALLRDGSTRLGVGLIRQDALAFQVTQPLDTAGPAPPVTLLLSPAPIFGNQLVEMAQRIKVMQLVAQGKAGEEELDFEAWTVNVPAMIWLFQAARSLRCAVVLSGDVHYAGTSVNTVGVQGADASYTTRYIQLTSSAARNSDGMTRGLAALDDLLYDDNGTAIFFQSDWASLLSHGASSVSHLGRLARAQVDQAFQNVLDAVNPVRQADAFIRWWRETPALTVESAREMAGRVAAAPANSARAIANDARWRVVASIDMIQDFRDDPLLAVFGDFFTAGPLLRDQLYELYGELRLDPSVGLRARSTVLVDRRSDRLAPYAAARLRLGAGTNDELFTAQAQRRTVGHANIGFISFVTRGGEVHAVSHELRWYPQDEPADPAQPLGREDWVGTLHQAGWGSRPEDFARTRR
jgi:hypothetical protein